VTLPRVVLIHWNEAEAAPRLAAIREAGYDAELIRPQSSTSLGAIAAVPPAAILIDLTRLPSQGRAVGIDLRRRKGTKLIPLVFLEGDAEKTAKTRELLPDATYGSYSGLRALLKQALRNNPAAPVQPSAMAGYSGAQLPKKFGIKTGSVTALIGAPSGFEAKLAPLPENSGLTFEAQTGATTAILFVRGRSDLLDGFRAATACLEPKGHLWVAWPKKSSGVVTDITGTFIREYVLAQSWVDFKVCAIDETWSGLCFARR
jgi:hypothetical protein